MGTNDQTRTPGRPPRAMDVLDALTAIAQVHFPELPAVITTDRKGRFESGWRLVGREHRPMGNVSMPLNSRQSDRTRMAQLVLAYAAHPDADQRRIVRTEHFPQSIVLSLD